MAHISVAIQNGDGKLKTLSLNLPMLFKAKFVYLIGDVQNALSIVSSNRIQNIQRVNSNINLWVLQPNQSIVEENIKPLLIENLFFLYQESVTSIHDFIMVKMLFKWLDHFDSQLQIVSTMGIDQLANILTLVWELTNNWAKIAKKMVYKEFIKILLESLVSQLRETWWWLTLSNIFIDFFG